ncbi:MAG: hypothetical protein HY326_02480 [Chloroflexi bacterium]|nr:hypothetical protein [Chloroflexota bacterium]
MKTRTSTVIGLVSMFVLGFIARGSVGDGYLNFVPSVQAQEDAVSGHRTCSNRTLKGTYGIKFEGLSLTAGPIASVAQMTFDGEGHFTSSEIGRLNGQRVARTFTGPYTVNADCTGFLQFPSELVRPHEARGEIVIVDGGKEFYVLDNEDGWVANGVGKKL